MSKEENDKWYVLPLGEKMYINDSTQVLRVPGGWVVTDFNSEGNGISVSSAFVPWNNEYQA